MGFANSMEYARIPWLLFLCLRHHDVVRLIDAKRDEGLTMFCNQAGRDDFVPAK
jgi:hypothetical protein